MWQLHLEKLYSLMFFISLCRKGNSTSDTSQNRFRLERVNLNQVVSGSYSNLTGIQEQTICGYQCYSDVTCVSFAFHPMRKECLLYDRNINQSSNVNTDEYMRSFVITLDGTNLAANKPTYSSTTGTGQTSQIVDGDTRPQDFYATFQCFQTTWSDLYPWVIIDLEEEYYVRFVYVYNANDYPERLHDVNYELYQENPSLNPSAVPNCCASVPHYTLGRNIIRCNPGVSGRFLKISIQKSLFFTLCEVEVYGIKVSECCGSDCEIKNYTCYKIPGGNNIALHKPVTQSSIFNYGDPHHGNDGLFSTSREQCTHTDHVDMPPYWQVDLESKYNVTSITIANRVDEKQGSLERLVDVTVAAYVDDPLNSGTPTVCKFIPGEFGYTVRTFECDQVTVGRWMRISKPTEYLAFCEVHITGTLM